MPPPTNGVTKQAAPTKLRQALNLGVLRGSCGTQQLLIMVMNFNKYRTTACYSKCGARKTVPLVCDYRTHRQRKSTRLRECPACKQREQGGEGGAVQAEVGEEGVAQVGAGEGGPQAGDGAVGEVDHAAVLAQSTSVKKAQPAFQMHRDLNAASNLWNVLAAECARLPRPAYLTRLQLHSCL
jgi:hypothetical protein